MRRRRSDITRIPGWSRIAGAVLLAISLTGVTYGVRAGMAQYIYHSVKRVSRGAASAAAILELCERAHTLYPWNYRLCLLAADIAYEAREAEPAPRAADLRARVRQWCERGLARNWYSRDLRWLMSQLLWEESPQKAIAYWREYTDWDFWFPFNHAMLAEMYARTEQFENAEKELAWTSGSEYYPTVSQTIAAEKQARQTGSTPSTSRPTAESP